MLKKRNNDFYNIIIFIFFNNILCYHSNYPTLYIKNKPNIIENIVLNNLFNDGLNAKPNLISGKIFVNDT